MTKIETNPNPEVRSETVPEAQPSFHVSSPAEPALAAVRLAGFRNSTFGFHSSFVIRHSSSVIRHSLFVIRHSSLLLALLLAGCSAPIGATRTSSRVAFKHLSASALNRDLSDATREVVHRYGLDAQLKRDPEGAFKLLHARACDEDRRDLLFALAELNYHHAEVLERSVKPGVPRRAPDFFLSSALYAWFFLLGDGREPPPGPFDQNFRIACNLYNRAVARGFAVGPITNSVVLPGSGLRQLAPGRVEVRLSEPPP